MKLNTLKIVEFRNPSGENVWRVIGMKKGERIRQNFPTRGQALVAKQNHEREIENLPVAPHTQETQLTPDKLREAERAFAELDGKASLLTAVRYFHTNYREPVTQSTVEKAFDAFIKSKEQQNLRPDSIASLKAKCKMFLALHGAKNVSEIIEVHAKEIIFRPGLSPVAQDNTRRALNCFFVWAEGKGFCAKSPLAKIGAITIDRDEPQILSLAEVRKVLFAAASHEHGVCLPFVAIGMFAGVRPKEIERMTWEDVNLAAKTITISGKAAKLRARRIVELSDNLVAWLKPFALSKPAFVGKNFRRHLDAVKVLAGFGGRKAKPEGDAPETPALKPWTSDVMRHTAISYHLAKWQHEGKTALWAGNSPDIIQRHYKALVDKEAAKSFWKIAPDAPESAKRQPVSKNKIIKLKAA